MLNDKFNSCPNTSSRANWSLCFGVAKKGTKRLKQCKLTSKKIQRIGWLQNGEKIRDGNIEFVFNLWEDTSILKLNASACINYFVQRAEETQSKERLIGVSWYCKNVVVDEYHHNWYPNKLKVTMDYGTIDTLIYSGY